MTTLLDRYLYQRFGRSLGVVLAAFVGIYLLVDFFERIDNFLEKQESLRLAAVYFACKTPFMIQQVAPAAIMLAGVLTVGGLQRSGEMQSLQAAGIRLRRLVRPVVIAGLAASLLVVALLQWLLPPSMAVTNRIWHQRLNTSYPVGYTKYGTVFQRGRQGFYYSVGLPDARGALHDFVYTEWDDEFRVVRQFTAQEAVSKGRQWRFREGAVKRVGSGGAPQVERFSRRTVELPEGAGDLFVPVFLESELSLTGLLRRSHDPQRGEEARRLLHARLSYALLGVPLLLVCLPILLELSIRWGRDLTVAVPAACMLAFFTWGVWAGLQSLAKSGAIPYLPASWSPHLFLGGMGLVALWRVGSVRR